jgi:hypothetical protein
MRSAKPIQEAIRIPYQNVRIHWKKKSQEMIARNSIVEG